MGRERVGPAIKRARFWRFNMESSSRGRRSRVSEYKKRKKKQFKGRKERLCAMNGVLLSELKVKATANASLLENKKMFAQENQLLKR